MDELQIDKLLLEIEVKQSNTAKTVNSIAKSVDKLTSSLTNFNTKAFDRKLGEIGKSIGKLKIDGQLSANFGKIGTALKNITNVDFDAQKLYKKFSSLTRIVKPFVAELKNAENALVAMNGVLNAKETSGGNKSSQKSKGNIFSVSNLYHIVRLINFVGRGLQKVGGFMKDIVQSGIDYTETLNLWQVAMGKNAEQAEDFIYRMSKAYGYATTTLMQYQATFRNMLSNLGGIDSNVSYKLSEYLMQMAGDYASLYNVTIEKAMQSFQSVLAGQVRPIRSVSGYDITENTIFELYQSLGGEKTMRQLSQTEKRLLRIMAIFQQMERSGAVGDMAKTLQNSANQLRIINEQVTELKTWLGNISEMYLRPVLPIVQAFLMVATEVAKVIAKDLGYEAFDGAIGGLEETNEQADELAGKLLSFDKFEALNSSSGDNALGIDSKLLDAMAKYEGYLEHSKTIAQQMADTILPLFINENGELQEGVAKIKNTIEKIFGFTKQLYTIDENGEFSWTEKAERIWEIVSKLFGTIKDIGAALEPIVNLALALSGDLLVSILDLVNSLVPALRFIMVFVNVIAIVLSAILETISKIIQSLAWLFKIKDWGKGNLGAIWSDWSLTSNYANEVFNAEDTKWVGGMLNEWQSAQYYSAPRFSNYNSNTNGITSPSTAMTQSVYNSTVAANMQTGGYTIEGLVNIDGKPAGQFTSKYSYAENKRIGKFTAKV